MWYENRLNPDGSIYIASNVANMEYTQRWCRNSGVSCVYNEDNKVKKYTATFTKEFFESKFENTPG